MPNPQPPIQESAYTYYFLNLVPGYWWEYTDVTHPGQTLRLECVQLSPDNPHKFQLKSNPGGILPEMVMEVHEVPEAGAANQECIWDSATMMGQTLTWKGGLHFPIGWTVGKTVEATSVENLPAGHAKVTLKKMEDFKPPNGSIFAPGGFQLNQIDIEIIVQVAGVNVFYGTLTFVGALGLYSAKFHTWGGPWGADHLLTLKSWSGKPH